MEQQTKERINLALKIIAILALMIIMMNQLVGLMYKGTIAMKPCDVCLKANPELSLCPNYKIIDLNNLNLTSVEIVGK